MAHLDPDDDVSDLARALGHTRETWESAGHTYAPYSDRFYINRYVTLGPPPLQVVAASAPPPAPKETLAVGPDGCLIMNTRADALLRAWTAPIAAGVQAASKPLLVIGQTIWPVVTKALRQLHAYPTNYPRIDPSEFPHDDQTLMAFRANTASARVVMVSLPSVPVAAMFALSDGSQAPAVDRIQAFLPQHRFAFFTTAAKVDLDHLPAVLTERYCVLTWRDTHVAAGLPAGTAPPDQAPVYAMVEASHTRAGGVLALGVTPAQRLGLETAPYRDALNAAMHQETAAVARRIAAMEGHVAKRMKPNEAFTNPARAMNPQLQGFRPDFGRYTNA